MYINQRWTLIENIFLDDVHAVSLAKVFFSLFRFARLFRFRTAQNPLYDRKMASQKLSDFFGAHGAAVVCHDGRLFWLIWKWSQRYVDCRV